MINKRHCCINCNTTWRYLFHALRIPTLCPLHLMLLEIAFFFLNGKWLVQHVVVRNGHVWFWWVFSLDFVVRTLRDSMMMFSWSCFKQEEFNVFDAVLDKSQAPPSLNRSGWLVWRLRKASLGLCLSPVSSGIVHDFLKIRIIVRNRSKCLVVLSHRPNLFFSSPYIYGFKLFWKPIVLTVCPNTPMISLWTSVELFESWHTDLRLRR